jgi:hypothetical protein
MQYSDNPNTNARESNGKTRVKKGHIIPALLKVGPNLTQTNHSINIFNKIFNSNIY